MFFYFSLIVILYLLFTFADSKWLSETQKRILCIIPFILLFLISIFRFDVGYDYFSYYELVTDITDEGAERFEPLSYSFVCLARYLESPCLLFILFGIPTYLPVFWFCHKTKHSQLTFWTFIFLFWLNTFGIIRQAAAMGIILIAISCIYSRKYILYLFLCIVASLFHYTALIMLPFYFIYHHCSWKFVLTGMFVMTISIQAIFSLLINNGIYATYLLGDNEFKGGTVVRFFYIGLTLLLLLLSYKNKILDKLQRSFVILIPSFFFPFILGGALGGRLSLYLYLIFLYLIPVILSHSRKKIRMEIMLLLCVYFFALLYVSSQNPTKSPNIPYQHIFEVDLEHPNFRY